MEKKLTEKQREREIRNYTHTVSINFRDLYILKSGIKRTCIKCEKTILAGQYCLGKGYYNHCLKCGEEKMKELDEKLDMAKKIHTLKKQIYKKNREEYKKNNLICSI